MHIPKCAGSSIHGLLRSNFESNSFFHERFNAIEKYSLDELSCKTVFSGHFDAWRIGLIPGPKRVFTFLRDPIERIISLYNFWRSHEWSVIEERNLIGQRVAKSKNILEFLVERQYGIQSNIDNFYVRYAMGKAESTKTRRFLKESPEAATKEALNFYESLDFVGLTEYIGEGIDQLSKLLKLEKVEVKQTNRSLDSKLIGREFVEPLEICEDSFAIMRELTRWDRVIYEHFEARL